MTWVEQYQALAGYNTWMNERLYAAAGPLSDAERKRDLGAFFKSVHGTLNHLVLADCIWLARFTGDPGQLPHAADGTPIAFSGLDQELYADFAELSRQRAMLDARIRTWTASLTAERLQGELSYSTTRGVLQSQPLWQALSHAFNHQTHHRGQVTTLLKQLGVDPGVTDLIAYLRDFAAVVSR